MHCSWECKMVKPLWKRAPRWVSGKESACQMQETRARSLVWDDPLEKDTATILAGKNQWTQESGGYSPWGHKRVRHDLATKQRATTVENSPAAAAAKSLPTVRPQRRQPTRLPRPWDSPGKNTGVGCHFLLQCRKAKSESEVAQLCPTLSDPMDCSPPGPSVHGIFQARMLEWGAIAFSGKQYEVSSNKNRISV